MPNIPQDLYDALVKYASYDASTTDTLEAVVNWWKEENKPKQRTSELAENNLFALLDKAKSNIMYPRIVIPTDCVKRGKLVVYMSKDKTKIQFVDTGKFPDNEYYGSLFRSDNKLLVNARHCNKDVRALIDALIADPIGLGKVTGQQYANCCFCGKLLRNKNSLTVGYGPICAENWGLPWEGTAEAARLAAIEDDLKEDAA